MSDTKTLVAHLGLGDSILLSGAAVALAKTCGRLRVPCYERYLASVKSFYVYHPEIEVYPVDNPVFSTWGIPPIECFDIVGEPVICGFYKVSRGMWDKSFPEFFYSQLGVEYHHRWDSCPIGAAWRKVEQIAVVPNCLVHDDWRRAFNITRNIGTDVYRVEFGNRSVLEHAFAIQNASEIHCIDSSIFHLVECLDTKGDLYLHRYARHYRGRETDYPSRKPWSVIT
jgi:hypothetical protein